MAVLQMETPAARSPVTHWIYNSTKDTLITAAHNEAVTQEAALMSTQPAVIKELQREGTSGLACVCTTVGAPGKLSHTHTHPHDERTGHHTSAADRRLPTTANTGVVQAINVMHLT